MKPVIFLDIDGVVHPYKVHRQNPSSIPDLHMRLAREKNWPGIAQLGEKLVNQFWFGFDHDALARIAQLQKEFDAQIVITSSWRVYYKLDQLISLFKMFDIDVHALLPMGFPRSDVIKAYALDHHLRQWIAIDDMDMAKPLAGHFVKTDDVFSAENLIEARRRLAI